MLQGRQAHREMWALLDQQDQQGRRVSKEFKGQQALLERKATQDLQGQLALTLQLPDLPDLRAHRESKALSDLQGRRVYRVFRAFKVSLDLLALQEAHRLLAALTRKFNTTQVVRWRVLLTLFLMEQM